MKRILGLFSFQDMRNPFHAHTLHCAEADVTVEALNQPRADGEGVETLKKRCWREGDHQHLREQPARTRKGEDRLTASLRWRHAWERHAEPSES